MGQTCSGYPRNTSRAYLNGGVSRFFPFLHIFPVMRVLNEAEKGFQFRKCGNGMDLLSFMAKPHSPADPAAGGVQSCWTALALKQVPRLVPGGSLGCRQHRSGPVLSPGSVPGCRGPTGLRSPHSALRAGHGGVFWNLPGEGPGSPPGVSVALRCAAARRASVWQ